MNYNKVILAGNLTRDPTLRFLPSNTPICDFGLAINRKWKDRDGNQKDETCFVDCSAFGRSATTINEYVKKGEPLLIEGRLRFDIWEDKTTKQKRSKLGVIVEGFQFAPRPKQEHSEPFPTQESPGAPAGEDIPF
jgi:single-strand DNA-binding protein